MSNAQHPEAKLFGFAGPFYPEGITELKFMGSSGVELQQFAEQLISFKEIDRPTTRDGYAWFWALLFEPKKGKQIVLALPWAQDWRRSDGTTSDRSPAIYTHGNVSEQDIQQLLESLANACQ